MAKKKENKPAELVAIQPMGEVTVLPPNQGVVGRFLEETENMFKARAMRMSGLLRRINESGQRTEALLRIASERMEAAEAKLSDDLGSQGLIEESEVENEEDHTE